jgi:hypothetical protein
MSQAVGPALSLVPEPSVRRQRLIRLTARLVARMLETARTAQAASQEAEHEPGPPLSARVHVARAQHIGGHP